MNSRNDFPVLEVIDDEEKRAGKLRIDENELYRKVVDHISDKLIYDSFKENFLKYVQNSTRLMESELLSLSADKELDLESSTITTPTLRSDITPRHLRPQINIFSVSDKVPSDENETPLISRSISLKQHDSNTF